MAKKQHLWLRKIWLFGGQLCLGFCLCLLLGWAPSLATVVSVGLPVRLPPASQVLHPTPPALAPVASGAIAATPTDVTQWLQQGRESYQAGQFTAAKDYWQQAVNAAQSGLDRALALSYLSLAYQQLGQLTEAQSAIAASLAWLQARDRPPVAGQTAALAQALNTQGSLQLAQGLAEAALATWKQAAATYAQAGDEAGRVGSLVNQVQALQALGLYLQARRTLADIEQAIQQQTDPHVKAVALHSLGDTLRAIGDTEGSQRVLTAGLAVAQAANLDDSEILLSLGNTAFARQDTATALKLYEQAMRSPVLLTKTQAQLNELNLLINQKQWSDAQALQAQIRAHISDLPLSRATVYAQINFAQSLLRLRQRKPDMAPSWREIGQISALAVQQAQTLQDQQAQAYAIGKTGSVYEQTQQWADAQKLTQQALVLAQAINAPDIAYQYQWQLGRLQKAQGNRPAAIAAYTEAVKTLKTLRNELVAVNSEVQFSFRESVEPVYRQLVSLLLQPDANGEVDQTNLQQARDVIESLQLAQLENFFQEACLNARPAQIDRVDREAAVFYSIILDDRLAVILSLPNQPLRYYATTMPQAQIERTLEKMWRSLRRTSGSEERLQAAKQVYNLLLRPAETDLANSGVKTLVFVLDGTLQNLPMAALYDGRQYLIEKYSIALSPGMQLLEPSPLEQKQLRVLVGALSEASQGFSPLPGVEAEIQQISGKLPTQVLLNQGFTSAALQSQIEASPYPVVHLATHGQFSSNVRETFILAWDSPINVKRLDSLLRVRDQRDRTPIELLVLSACQTAAGDRRATLGLAGVAVRSGARSTLATLWSVDDESTASLMVKFYQGLAQADMTKAEALRQAQLELQKHPEFQHPYFWAPFVMVGNWL